MPTQDNSRTNKIASAQKARNPAATKAQVAAAAPTSQAAAARPGAAKPRASTAGKAGQRPRAPAAKTESVAKKFKNQAFEDKIARIQNQFNALLDERYKSPVRNQSPVTYDN